MTSSRRRVTSGDNLYIETIRKPVFYEPLSIDGVGNLRAGAMVMYCVVDSVYPDIYIVGVCSSRTIWEWYHGLPTSEAKRRFVCVSEWFHSSSEISTTIGPPSEV